MRYDRDLWLMATALVENNGRGAVGLAVGKIKSLHQAGDEDGAIARELAAIEKINEQIDVTQSAAWPDYGRVARAPALADDAGSALAFSGRPSQTSAIRKCEL